MRPNTKHLVAALVVVAILATAATAYTTLFSAGSGTTYETASGLVVSTSTDHNLSGTNPFNGTDSVRIDGVNISSSGPADLTVDRFRGDWTNVSSVNATQNEITINPDDKAEVRVAGDVTAVSWQSGISIDGDSYLSYSAAGDGNITVTGLTANANYTAALANGTYLDSGQTDGTGEATIAVGAATDGRLVLFRNAAPEVNNAGASPQDGEVATTSDVELSISVSDATFNRSIGDEVEVTFFVDGEQVYDQTISKNRTVSTFVTLDEGGQHNWSVSVEDRYRASSESDANTSTAEPDPFVFETPSELRIYNESDPDQLIDNLTVKIQFYFEESGDLVVTRNATNGTVDLSGLPVNEPFVVVARADGYLSRRVYVESLTEQQSIYLLPETEEFVETRFVLEDFTGLYQKEDTVLVIQRAINDSWTNVESDFFGATGTFPTQLDRDVRHRLILVNTESGGRRPLGTFTPLRDGVQTVEVLSLAEIQVRRQQPEVAHQPALSSLRAENETDITVGIAERSDPLTSWSVEIQYVAQDGSTTTLSTYSASDPGNITRTINLSDRAGGTVRVVVSWETESGRTGTTVKNYSVRQSYSNQYSLLQGIAGVTARLPGSNAGVFGAMVSILVTTLATGAVGSRYRLSTEQTGLVAMLWLFAFGIVGWIGWPLVFVAAVAWVAVAAIRRGL